MLEKDVTQLDRDFMILYSSYTINSLYGEEDEFFMPDNVILKLIKLGQLNTIQLYYNEPFTPFEYGKNEEIIKEAKKYLYYPNDYNELYAASCACFADECNYLRDAFNWGIRDDKEIIDLEKLEEIKNNSQGYKYLQMAIDEATRINNESPNLLLEAFICEMKLNSRFVRLLRQSRRTDNGPETIEYEKEVKKYVDIKNKLKKELKKDSNNDVLAFTLAKSILILNRFGKANTMEVKLFKKILKKICNKRKYSNLINTTTR